MTARILTGLVGLLMGLTAINWLINPAGAAAGLGMPLLEGIGRSTQIGDFSAFFIAITTFCILGIISQASHWLYSAALLLGLAALMRTLAWAVHGAPFAVMPIGVEVVTTAMLLIGARLMTKPQAST